MLRTHGDLCRRTPGQTAAIAGYRCYQHQALLARCLR